MLIFLDIDGVMVPANSWKRPEFLTDEFPAFTSRATNALQKIIFETGADIILTTSHKSKYSLDEWQQIFKLRKIAVKKIMKLPENLDHKNRKEEILQWFSEEHIPENFIIIDDDKSLNSLPKSLKEKLILTSGTLGLTEELADLAIEILKQPLFSQ